jgi:hypothetical protein
MAKLHENAPDAATASADADFNDERVAGPTDEMATRAAPSEETDQPSDQVVRRALPSPARLGVAVAAGMGVAAVAAAYAVSRFEPDLSDGESVLFQTHPRKVGSRYLFSLGLWEITRRATQFIVTDRRVIIEEGVLYRSSRSVPLSDVLGVNVQAGPWQGFVELATSRGNRDPRRDLLGPLRSPEARELGRTIRQASVR